MMRLSQGLLFASIAAATVGCGTTPVTMAPAADLVRVTKDSADVASCAPLGSVDARQYPLDPANALRQMKNQAVGVGGNTLFVTFDPTDHAINRPNAYATGIAYRCVSTGPEVK